MLLLMIPLLVVAQKKQKSDVHFVSKEDTTWTKMKQRGVGATIKIVHTDFKCSQDKCIVWYRYNKTFILTDTGWKRTSN